MASEDVDVTLEEATEDATYLEEEEGVPAEGEEVAEEGEAVEEEAAVVDTTAITEVRDKVFEEIRLPAEVVAQTQQCWNDFLNSASSREAAGEAIYAALFDSAPSLQSLFKTPRAVMAMRFMGGLNTIINDMSKPSALKITVETLGFQHLDLEVTVPRVVIFRDAIVDLLTMEMGARLTSQAASGFISILNYVGGAYIYIRREYAGRLKLIASSWRTANNKAAEFGDEEEAAAAAEGEGEAAEGAEGGDAKAAEAEKEAEMAAGSGKEKNANARASGEAGNNTKSNNLQVPTDFNGMFMFNGAVMGFGGSTWMPEILEKFDAIVTNVANSYRLQEECDTLSLSLAKYTGTINLPEFKAVMLASLRSLVPKDWDGAHEVAWTWLWENVERMLKSLMGRPALMEKALERLIMSLTEDNLNYLRREVYQRFFALAPAGQDYFKQSTTRLYWIADRVVEMTIEMYRDPKKMVEDISALGLRHVGYAIPTEFFAPFVSGAVEVVRALGAPADAEDAFRWSLSLVSRILVRTITEGSTIVMKAINTNSEKQLRKAVACAPRGKRALWVLNITVGTQSISPLYWSIESGSLQSAKAMIEDLLTIRADRDNYYYGCTHMFERHPDIIQRLSADAADLLPVLLDGLIWRSRVATHGQRRVNYYVKHLMVDGEGSFNQALEWLVAAGDPKIVCHPVVVLFSDLIWSKIASWYFLAGKCWFLFTLTVFIIGQSVLAHLNQGNESEGERIGMFICRVFIYLGSMGLMIRHLVAELFTAIKGKNFFYVGRLPVPAFLQDWREQTSLVLSVTLLFMLTQEPIFWCAAHTEPQPGEEPFGGSGLFTQNCPEATSHKEAYSTASMLAMLFYWFLMVDLTIFSNQVSAYTLACGRVLSEVGLFLGALVFLVTSFASAISCLNQKNKDFAGIPRGALSLFEMALGMFPSNHFETLQEDAVVLTCVSCYIILVVIFLMNLLIAQLNGAYAAVYIDMIGFARLNRGKCICEMIAGASAKRWNKFIAGLGLDDRLEFNEGDVGIAGGIQVLEPANANPTTVDAVKRAGGSTSPSAQWPEEGEGDDDENKFDRIEKLVIRAAKSRDEGKASKRGKSGGSSAGGSENLEVSGVGGSEDAASQ
eukprot:TRINITY_DN2393_c0_g1_i2.p1 TRINITY_DN2393_c0_g1~~TRINITY_DN2393_c0_g1_i2.p1  ORF type:complete len:1119 (-),score=311.99 TRINITY_DN2393_c0_g1_i2:283-3639(-)